VKERRERRKRSNCRMSEERAREKVRERMKIRGRE